MSAEEPTKKPGIDELDLTNPTIVRKKKGLPRTGNWPIRKNKTKNRGHGWALSKQWKPLYIEGLSRYGIATPAADYAGITQTTVRQERVRDPGFDAECADALERYVDAVEAEVARRAIEGREVFVWDKRKGERVSLGKVPNDILLMFYAKKLRPEFRENYKADEQSATVAIGQMVVGFLNQFKPGSDQQALAPTFDEFIRGQAALPAPAETVEEKRSRLLAELAALEDAKADVASDREIEELLKLDADA